jgi:hypothetical protein
MLWQSICHPSWCHSRQPLSLLVFNVCVDAVVREWLHQMLGDNAAREGIGDDVAELVAFYIDNGLIASRDPVWLQSSFDILISLFECIRLYTNATKTKVMRCIPGRIREGYTEEEYTQHRTGVETATDRKHPRVDCQICGVSLQTGSLRGHLETQHDVYPSFILSWDIVVECPASVYHDIALTNTGGYSCLVANCVGGASTQWNLGQHFWECHPLDLVICPSEESAPLWGCTRCGMQTADRAVLHNHQKTKLCMERWRQQVQHETVAATQLSLEMRFFAYGNGSKYSNIWADYCLMMTMLPRP